MNIATICSAQANHVVDAILDDIDCDLWDEKTEELEETHCRMELRREEEKNNNKRLKLVR